MTKATKIGLGVFAALIIIAGIISSQSNVSLTNSSNTVPTDGSALPVLANSMPAFTDISRWYNTANGEPLSPDNLKGKVVLVDFWTYSCINCLRTLPFVKSLYEKYSPEGFVVVGVHTPEFTFEGDPTNVGNAIKENGIRYPVALDDAYGTWQAYSNQYWPAEYLFDSTGKLRHVQFGEGHYDDTEQAVRSLLAEASNTVLPDAGVTIPSTDFSDIGTKETYFGLARGDAFMGGTGAANTNIELDAIDSPANDKWTAGGTWKFSQQYVETESANNMFRFNVKAGALHLVLSSNDGTDKVIDVLVDGVATESFTVNAPDLYTVAKFPNGGRHTVEIRIHDSGVQFFSATFS